MLTSNSPTSEASMPIPAGERKRAPLHPGQIVAGILKEQNISARACALAIHMTPQSLGDVLNGKTAVTASTALRLAAFLGNERSPELWLGLQADRDLWLARQELEGELKQIRNASPFSKKGRAAA